MSDAEGGVKRERRRRVRRKGKETQADRKEERGRRRGKLENDSKRRWGSCQEVEKRNEEEGKEKGEKEKKKGRKKQTEILTYPNQNAENRINSAIHITITNIRPIKINVTKKQMNRVKKKF